MEPYDFDQHDELKRGDLVLLPIVSLVWAVWSVLVRVPGLLFLLSRRSTEDA